MPVIHALGIDVGTTNTKVAVVRIDDRVDPVRVLRRATPDDGDGIRALVRSLVAEASAGIRIDAVGIASMAESGALLDADGRSIGPLLRWDSALDDPADDEDLRVRTGVPRPAKSTRSLLRRARRTTRAAAWAGGAELAALALCGRAVTDPTLALRTMLASLPALGEQVGWDDDLVAATGLSTEGLPALLDGTVGVDAAAASALGIAAGTPVANAGHDHAVAAWAVGARDASTAGDSIGTAEGVVRPASGAVDRAAAIAEGMSVGRTVDGDRETVLGGIPRASRLFSDLGALIGDSAASVMLDGPIVLPTPSGRQAPSPDPAARLAVIAPDGSPADLPADPAERLAAVARGLALQARWIGDVQARVLGAEPARTVVVGPSHAVEGLWWAAKRAVATPPLARVRIEEPVASGAALLAAVRAGLVDPGMRLPIEPVPPASDPGIRDALAAFVAASLEDPATRSATGAP